MENMEFRGSGEGEINQDVISPVTQEISLSECLVKLTNCEERYDEVKKENEEQHQKIVDLKTRIDYLQDEKNRLADVINSRNTEIMELRNEKEKLKKNIEECHTIAEQQREQIKECKREIQEKNTEIERQKEKQNECENRLKVLEVDNNNLGELLKSQTDKYEYKIADLNKELNGYHQKYDETKLQLDQCSETIASWHQEKEKLLQEITLLKEKIMSSRNFLMRIRNLSNEVNTILDELHNEKKSESQLQPQETFQSDSLKPPEKVIELPSLARKSDSEKSENNQDDYPWEDRDKGELIQF